MTPPESPHRATLIESLGVYLPPREVTTEELVRGCLRPNRFPLERMSGIKSRHVAGESEFSIDLAERALAQCLASSRHRPDDVDLIISASVARCDGPGLWVSHEPSTSLKLIRRFGLSRAIGFDVSNACAGMFTAISIVDTLIQQRVIECGLVVSGEYISHLGATAQKEIAALLDPRLACLTLGDAGAAVMLEATQSSDRGFAALDLTTFGSFSRYCMAYPTHEPHGGVIMVTDALKLTDAATRNGATHAIETMERAGWTAESFDHLIMHQTSRTALSGAMREINRRVKRRVCDQSNTIDNLARRGNTASTSHFVALADSFASGRIRSGDRVIFAISGSGLTVGTGLYTFDDLPERFTAAADRQAPLPIQPSVVKRGHATYRPLIPIESVAHVVNPLGRREDSLALLRRAATGCLDQSAYSPHELGVLIHAGVYRTDYVFEPAIAALLAGELGINANAGAGAERRTLAFDVFNGAIGFLNSCYVAAEMIRGERTAAAMIVTSEIENNADAFPQEMLGIEESGAAMILGRGEERDTGFGRFLFRSFTGHADAFTSRAINRNATTFLKFDQDPDLHSHYMTALATTVAELLDAERLTIDEIATFLPPQISSEFITGLSARLGAADERFVRAMPGDRDLYTASVPFAFGSIFDQKRNRPGDIGLVMTVGSGVQVGCALYHF